MLTKKLFVLVSDGGDGSYYPHFTFNEDWIKRMDAKYDDGECEDYNIGVDGDGFHYDVINVPINCTYATLGISDCSEGEEQ